jgi:hypothetical protein
MLQLRDMNTNVFIACSVTFLGLIGYSSLCVADPAKASSTFPSDYQGRPFADEVYHGGAQTIPGRIECAYYDLGGEGVAYHDTDTINHGSGELNLKPDHQRPHATPYIWGFRKDEGVDISYTKDFADFNHPNLFTPSTNQLYIGWTSDNEWCNYTVNVKQSGTYKITALYGNAANTIKFSVDNQPASECKLPLATGSMHIWNKAEIGTITFTNTGLHLLTFHYNAGNNFAYFDFEPANEKQ